MSTMGTATLDRDAMVVEHLPLARRLAWRYAHSPDMAEDLAQVAALALVRAVDRFDPDRGVAFSSFAAPTIVGEIKRHFRNTRWALHVPRELQERAWRVERQIEESRSRLGREPRPAEVASALEMTVEDVLEAQAAFGAAFDTRSLDAPLAQAGDDSAESAGDLIGEHDPGYALAESRAAVAPGLARLSERDRRVLELRFMDDLTQAEIGARLGVSQMHVSRILRRALDRLSRSL